MSNESQGLKVGVSISRKLNLGNYESAEVYVSVSGLAADTTPAEIQAALAAGALGYEALKVAMVAKIEDQRHPKDVGAPRQAELPEAGTEEQRFPRRTALMSVNQRNKLIELYIERFGGTEAEALQGLDAVFESAFKHPMSEATLAEASKIVSQMIAQKSTRFQR